MRCIICYSFNLFTSYITWRFPSTLFQLYPLISAYQYNPCACCSFISAPDHQMLMLSFTFFWVAPVINPIEYQGLIAKPRFCKWNCWRLFVNDSSPFSFDDASECALLLPEQRYCQIGLRFWWFMLSYVLFCFEVKFPMFSFGYSKHCMMWSISSIDSKSDVFLTDRFWRSFRTDSNLQFPSRASYWSSCGDHTTFYRAHPSRGRNRQFHWRAGDETRNGCSCIIKSWNGLDWNELAHIAL